ncbi:MAG TPA: condensation domain-containing protein, partial [Pseudonocardiaceae bacterium]
MPDVGIDDVFFDLGGHSLLAAKLIGRIRSALDAELRLRDLFAAPTPAGLAEILDGAATARPALRPGVRPDLVPLSPAQSRLWFLDQFDGPGSAYHIAHTLRLSGPLDTTALADAVTDLMTRHEALRTVYPAVDGRPVQHVLPVAAATIRELAADEIAAEAHRPFDLAAEPPIRVAVAHVGQDEHVLLVTLHHIAGDGASMRPLLADLAHAYTARATGDSPQWAELPVQYVDYTLWQRDLLDGALCARQLDFWRTHLAGIPARIDLPTDRPRPTHPTHRADIVGLTVPAETSRALQALAAGHGTTLFMVLHAALAALLTRLGAGFDVPIGTVVAGRSDPALDDLVGFFVNTLVLRADTGGDPTFVELLRRVRNVDLAAMDNADLPFDRLVEELNPDRAEHHPLFQTMLVLQNNDGATLSFGDAACVPEPVWNVTAKFDLTFGLTETADGLTGHLEFDTDLFDVDTARAIAARLVRLLTAVAAEPETRMTAIDLLDADERHRILTDWSGSDPARIDRCVHELIADQAARTPDAVALIHGDTRVTYAQLDNHANVVARELVAAGVMPGDVVGIRLDREPSLVVAVLGALKAGACYTMLDPSFPAERLDLLVRVANPRVVVESVPAMPVGFVAAPVVAVSPAVSACLMFTSGSTGKPKGVLAPHRAIVATLMGQDFVDFSGIWLQCSPLSWDAFALELFGPLLHGATCVLQPGSTPEPAVIAELICSQAVTTVHLSASLLNFMIDEYPDVFAGVRQVMTGGE